MISGHSAITKLNESRLKMYQVCVKFLLSVRAGEEQSPSGEDYLRLPG